MAESKKQQDIERQFIDAIVNNENTITYKGPITEEEPIIYKELNKFESFLDNDVSKNKISNDDLNKMLSAFIMASDDKKTMDKLENNIRQIMNNTIIHNVPNKEEYISSPRKLLYKPY